MISLVGYTGFVGSNIYTGSNGTIEGLYNSKNIEDAYGTKPDLLIYAGLRAEKYLANNDPQKDMNLITEAEKNIERIAPKRLVLISTIDVFKEPKNVDENSDVDTEGLHPYGYNRYMLEKWVRENYEDALIIRLPGLFGNNIKKNFVYDYINVIPFMLNAEKYKELEAKEPKLKEYYNLQDNGFYKVDVTDENREELKDIFRRVGFSALNFTDSRSRYQFYNLKNLWTDINKALDNDIRLWHPATEPISAGELYKYLTGKEFVNELNGTPADYDYRTIHGKLFGGDERYICGKETVLMEIKKFLETQSGT